MDSTYLRAYSSPARDSNKPGFVVAFNNLGWFRLPKGNLWREWFPFGCRAQSPKNAEE